MLFDCCCLQERLAAAAADYRVERAAKIAEEILAAEVSLSVLAICSSTCTQLALLWPLVKFTSASLIHTDLLKYQHLQHASQVIKQTHGTSMHIYSRLLC